MPELLLELFSEEIPARMQAKAAEDLRAAITNGLVEAGLTYEGAQVHATPRRLVLSVEGLDAKARDVREERKGPRVDAPPAAIEGFLKSTGLTLDQLTKQDDKKGQVYIAVISKPGRAATDIIADLVPDVIRKFPWPKSMRWGSGALKWVRPLQSILCTFDGEVVPFEIDGIISSNATRGHRFLSSGTIHARRYDDYVQKLHDAHVIVNATVRSDSIKTEATNLAFAQGLEVVEDDALLREVAGLVEWPVVLMGEFDTSYLDVPPEVIITTIKNNQKCFCLRDAKTGRLANKYLLIANTIARDGGKEIIRGNNKVIAARLSDAKFFWDQDRMTRLEVLLPKLNSITFHARLGTQAERVMRIEALAGEIGKVIGLDAAGVDKAKQAARLAKADLVTGMVGEFPELQGLMGGYYAGAQGADGVISNAIRDHYRPQGPSDILPETKVGHAVALADKLDTLMGFWGIDEKPTGSKDPFALRRAALGVVRILLEKKLKFPFGSLVHSSEKQKRPFLIAAHIGHRVTQQIDWTTGRIRSAEVDSDVHAETGWSAVWRDISGKSHRANIHFDFSKKIDEWSAEGRELAASLLSFFADRLKVYLKDQGKRHDLIDAVFALGGQDDLLLIVRRVEALSAFLATDDGKNLLAGVKRASNILRIEEKKDGTSYDGAVNDALLSLAEEKSLNAAVNEASSRAKAAVEQEDFATAMTAIASLRAPVDAFFEKVTVNDADAAVRANRLALLNRIRAATAEVADFSKIEG